MKDLGIYIGAGSSAFCQLGNMGNFYKYEWWELIVVGAFILLKILFWGAIGEVLFMTFKEIKAKEKGKWTGKKKVLKPVT